MAAGGKLHLPSATFEDLCALPGVGPALARRILEYGAQQPLADINELRSVPGMTSALVERLRPRLAVDGPDAIPSRPEKRAWAEERPASAPFPRRAAPSSPEVRAAPATPPKHTAAVGGPVPTAPAAHPQRVTPAMAEEPVPPAGHSRREAFSLVEEPATPSAPSRRETPAPPAEPAPPVAAREDDTVSAAEETRHDEAPAPAPGYAASEPAGSPPPHREPSTARSSVRAAPGSSLPSPGAGRPAFNADENWPRAYGGINPAVLFGEADHALASDCPDPPKHRPNFGALRAILLVESGALLGALAALAAIYFLNGGFGFLSQKDWEQSVVQPLATVQAESVSVTGRVEQVESAQARFESTIGPIDERVQALESANQQIDALVLAVDALHTDVADLQTKVDQFGSFLEGLKSAVDQLTP